MRKVHRSTIDDLTRQAERAGPSHAGPVIHEEDAEDAGLGQVLPPMYCEAWAERRFMELRDGATGVTRPEKGYCTEDYEALPLNGGEADDSQLGPRIRVSKLGLRRRLKPALRFRPLGDT